MPQTSVWNKMLRGFESHLATLAGSTPVQSPNVSFTPTKGTAYLRSSLLPGQTVSASIGTNGNDLDYLTVGCLEIGYGIPRTLMLDELMFHLEAAYPKFSRPLLEGIGRLEWPSGFTPYWVYDKYGFQQSEIINKRTKIMEKRIHKS